MLLHSKTLLHLYPEQLWLGTLEESGKFDQNAEENKIASPKFCKPNNTAYKLRQLEISKAETVESPLSHLIHFFTRKAA
jgi:hypothetical protein